jgi:hypothetical protein
VSGKKYFEPLILTLGLIDSEAAYFDGLRQKHFPPERNFIAAHLAVFHDLPAAERCAIDHTLAAITAETRTISYRVIDLRMLGHGVAFAIKSPELSTLRAHLASSFANWLTPQDRAGFFSHMIIQNKVHADTAKAPHARLVGEFAPWSAIAPGLDIWSVGHAHHPAGLCPAIAEGIHNLDDLVFRQHTLPRMLLPRLSCLTGGTTQGAACGKID